MEGGMDAYQFHKKIKPEDEEKVISIAKDAHKNQDPEVSHEDFPRNFSEKKDVASSLKKKLQNLEALKVQAVPEELFRDVQNDVEQTVRELEQVTLTDEYADQKPEYHAKLEKLAVLKSWLGDNEIVPTNVEELKRKIKTLNEILKADPNLN
jgi:hypothetical protein